MLRYTLAAAVTAGLLLPAPSAMAAKGWHAVQSQSSNKNARTAHLYYADHNLMMRSDGDPNRMVINLPTGLMTMIDESRKVYTQATLQELMAMRNQMKEQMKARMAQMPAELRANIEKMMKEQEEAEKKPLKIKSTGKKDKVAGHACGYYTWTGPEGEGKSCIAKKLPVSTKAFQADAIKLVKAMKKAGAGSAAATNLVELQLAEHGFPLKTVRTLKMGPQSMETTVTLQKIEAADVPAADMAPPKGFKKATFQDFMQIQAAPR